MTKKEAADKLYQINSWISGHFVTKIKKITYEDICKLNEMLAWVIKELRGNDGR